MKKTYAIQSVCCKDIDYQDIKAKDVIQLSPNEGFLFEDNYGYKETSKDLFIELTSTDEISKIKINLTDDSESLRLSNYTRI